MLILCRQGLTEQEFDRVGALVADLPFSVRWKRRGGRLVLLLEHARGDQPEVSGLLADPAVEYVIRDPSDDEITRIFSRRDLLGLALASTGVLTAGIILGPTVLYTTAPSEGRLSSGDLFVGQLDDFPVNGSRTRLVEGHEYVIVRPSETRLFALSATCTHSDACLVHWDAERGQLLCPCHRGLFDLHGNVVAGPPPRPLASRPVVVRDGQVYVKGAQA